MQIPTCLSAYIRAKGLVGGQYVDPQTKRLVHIDREIVKHRFLRGEIDVIMAGFSLTL